MGKREFRAALVKAGVDGASELGRSGDYPVPSQAQADKIDDVLHKFAERAITELAGESPPERNTAAWHDAMQLARAVGQSAVRHTFGERGRLN